MNIFVLDEFAAVAAQYHCDKHIPKMILETAQMLCTAVHLISGKEVPYKPCYINHPCTVWARASRGNFLWLLNLGLSLCKEYRYRFLKVHKTQEVLEYLNLVYFSLNFAQQEQTPFALCMPDKYKDEKNPVQAYRDFYNGE